MIRTTLASISARLTPPVREAIYALSLVFFTAIGLTTQAVGVWLPFVQAVIAFLAALNTPWRTGTLAKLRGVIYSVAATSFAVAGFYDVVTDAQIANWSAVVSAALALMAMWNTNRPVAPKPRRITQRPAVKKAPAKKAPATRPASTAVKKTTTRSKR